jgi:hypothetical protein
VASTKRVGTGKSDDLLIVEAHSVEDDSKVVLSLDISLTFHFPFRLTDLGGV